MKTYLDKIFQKILFVLESSLSLLPKRLQIRLAKLNYYKISNNQIKHVIFHIFNFLLKNLQGDIYVYRKYIRISGKKIKYNLKLNLRSYVNRLFFYKDINIDLGNLMSILLTKEDTYIDVGANIGQTALMGGYFSKKVIAFEPVPEMISFLKENININPSEQVKLYEFALSNSNEKKRISVSLEKDGIHTMNPQFEKFIQNNYDHSVLIEARTFDSLNLGEVKMIKIDVEGHELEVLDGMKNSLKNISFVVCETTPIYYEKIKEIFENNSFEQIKEYGDYREGMMNLFFVNKNKVLDINNIRHKISN